MRDIDMQYSPDHLLPYGIEVFDVRGRLSIEEYGDELFATLLVSGEQARTRIPEFHEDAEGPYLVIGVHGSSAPELYDWVLYNGPKKGGRSRLSARVELGRINRDVLDDLRVRLFAVDIFDADADARLLSSPPSASVAVEVEIDPTIVDVNVASCVAYRIDDDDRSGIYWRASGSYFPGEPKCVRTYLADENAAWLREVNGDDDPVESEADDSDLWFDAEEFLEDANSEPKEKVLLPVPAVWVTAQDDTGFTSREFGIPSGVHMRITKKDKVPSRPVTWLVGGLSEDESVGGRATHVALRINWWD
ncbi:hypothetical protein [Agrococcus baldri]|uniref:hypothetical protein n=1 Tax=Agrococcus baldri TaxID=153730 RepID=UPI001160803E|nr:hypothetical protein [Agrococcus baldri]